MFDTALYFFQLANFTPLYTNCTMCLTLHTKQAPDRQTDVRQSPFGRRHNNDNNETDCLIVVLSASSSTAIFLLVVEFCDAKYNNNNAKLTTCLALSPSITYLFQDYDDFRRNCNFFLTIPITVNTSSQRHLPIHLFSDKQGRCKAYSSRKGRTHVRFNSIQFFNKS